jgi:hypothetical protein
MSDADKQFKVSMRVDLDAGHLAEQAQAAASRGGTGTETARISSGSQQGILQEYRRALAGRPWAPGQGLGQAPAVGLSKLSGWVDQNFGQTSPSAISALDKEERAANVAHNRGQLAAEKAEQAAKKESQRQQSAYWMAEMRQRGGGMAGAVERGVTASGMANIATKAGSIFGSGTLGGAVRGIAAMAANPVVLVAGAVVGAGLLAARTLNQMSSHYGQYNFAVAAAGAMTQYTEVRKDIAMGKAYAPALTEWEKFKQDINNDMADKAGWFGAITNWLTTDIRHYNALREWDKKHQEENKKWWREYVTPTEPGEVVETHPAPHPSRSRARHAGHQGGSVIHMPAQGNLVSRPIMASVNNDFHLTMQNEDAVSRAVEQIRTQLFSMFERHDTHIQAAFAELRGHQLTGAF